MWVLCKCESLAPQRTHFWNNKRFRADEAAFLHGADMLHCEGIPTACERFLWKIIPIFHMPLFGGWHDYVVIEPRAKLRRETWYIGWIADDGCVGVSQIPLDGPVRVLIGKDPVRFFGLTEDGSQIRIKEIGRGRIGDRGPFKNVPLR
jgi:hypothetical protein